MCADARSRILVVIVPDRGGSMTTTTQHITRPHAATSLWKGAALTAAAAVLFPRVNAVIYDDQKIWQLDPEAAVLIPVVVIVTLAVFAVVGRVALRGTDNR